LPNAGIAFIYIDYIDFRAHEMVVGGVTYQDSGLYLCRRSGNGVTAKLFFPQNQSLSQQRREDANAVFQFMIDVSIPPEQDLHNPVEIKASRLEPLDLADFLTVQNIHMALKKSRAASLELKLSSLQIFKEMWSVFQKIPFKSIELSNIMFVPELFWVKTSAAKVIYRCEIGAALAGLPRRKTPIPSVHFAKDLILRTIEDVQRILGMLNGVERLFLNHLQVSQTYWDTLWLSDALANNRSLISLVIKHLEIVPVDGEEFDHIRIVQVFENEFVFGRNKAQRRWLRLAR
jgi:hypothetical protein